jgi:hypothetical protein
MSDDRRDEPCIGTAGAQTPSPAQVVAPSRTSTTAVTLITLDVLPEEIGELPDSDSYVSIEVRAKRSR